MKEITKIVIYKSKTGFTEKYARWIADALRCDAVCMDKNSLAEAARYDVVIFGGGMHAGAVNGIKFIRNSMSSLAGKKIIVFATGAAPPIPDEIERIINHNLPGEKDLAFFYFQSGMNYARIRGADRLLMGIFRTVLKMKKNKSGVEQGTADTIQNSYDYSSRGQTQPLIDFVNAAGFAE